MTTSSITAALPGTASSTSRGQSCPSACAIGHIGPDQRDLLLAKQEHVATTHAANAAPNNNAVEGSGTDCEDWEGADDGAVIELSLLIGTSSLRFRVASSSGNLNSSGGIVVGISGMSEGCVVRQKSRPRPARRCW